MKIKPIWTLCACQAVLAGGQALAFPFFAMYLRRDRGLTLPVVGAWLSLSVAITAVSQFFGGELSDFLGRRRVMIASLVLRAAAISGLAAAIGGRWAFSFLIGFHLAASFMANFFDPAARSWIADHAGSTERHRAYALLRSAHNIGYAVGPAIGGFLAARSYAAAFGVSAVICLVGAAMLAAGVPDQAAARPAEKLSWPDMAGVFADFRFFRLCLCNALVSIAMAQLVVTLSVYASDFLSLRENQVGLLFALNGLLVAALQYPAALALGEFALSHCVVAGCLMYAAGYAWVGAASGFFGMMIGMAIVTVGEILVPAGVAAITANMAPARSRGRYLGVLGLSHQAGSALGPLLGGLGLQYLSARHAGLHWAAVASVAAASALAFFAVGRRLGLSEQGLVDLDFLAEEPGDYQLEA